MSAHDTGNPTLTRLDDEIQWYDRKSRHSQGWFKRLKILQVCIAAAIPVTAGQGQSLSPWVTGSLGALIVVLEGIQSLNQYQQNWSTYRSTCENLKHEKYLWLAKAGPYHDNKQADQLLAERVESLISSEHAKWVGVKTEKT